MFTCCFSHIGLFTDVDLCPWNQLSRNQFSWDELLQNQFSWDQLSQNQFSWDQLPRNHFSWDQSYKINSHEINFHKINSHEVNFYEINSHEMNHAKSFPMRPISMKPIPTYEVNSSCYLHSSCCSKPQAPIYNFHHVFYLDVTHEIVYQALPAF